MCHGWRDTARTRTSDNPGGTMSQPTQPTQFVSAFQALDASGQQDVVNELARTNPGLFDFDKTTRRLVWVGLFVVLLSVVIGAFVLINNSFGVDLTTTTG